MHRDYSPVTRGTQVQVGLYPDRLIVRSPGGLYGGVAVDELGEEGISSSRNAVLASLLADTYLPSSQELVAENRSSGIPAMLDVARRRGLPRPSIRSSITSFVVTMPRSELLGPEVLAWMAGLGADPAPASAAPAPSTEPKEPLRNRSATVEGLACVDETLQAQGEAAAGQLVELTGLSRSSVLSRLRALTNRGIVEAIGPARSPQRRYRWIGATLRSEA